MNEPVLTPSQEKANALTHAAGLLFCLVAIPILIGYAYYNGSAGTVWAVSIFGFGTLMVYCSSTLYHASTSASTKRKLRVWDHISIFFLIAGSYTPFVAKYLQPDLSFMFLCIVWSIVIVGTLKKLFFTGKFEALSVILYLGMGWMAVFILKPLLQNMPLEVFYLIVAGGLFYTVGIIFYLWKRWTYHHAIWHCFVLSGTIAHYFAVLFSVPVHSKV